MHIIAKFKNRNSREEFLFFESIILYNNLKE